MIRPATLLLIAALLCKAASQSDIDKLYPGIEALYMDLHANPELAFQEKQTAAKLAARLKNLGYEVTTASAARALSVF